MVEYGIRWLGLKAVLGDARIAEPTACYFAPLTLDR
jgi:hypothetical protein